MLLFCPSCSNLLTVSQTTDGNNRQCNRLECLTCPYESLITSRIYERTDFPAAEEKDDVFGGKGSWDNAQKMATQCPKENCNGMEAAYFEVQIRSADEPATIFYKCMTCGGSWRV